MVVRTPISKYNERENRNIIDNIFKRWWEIVHLNETLKIFLAHKSIWHISANPVDTQAPRFSKVASVDLSHLNGKAR